MTTVKLMDGYDTVVDRTKLRVVVQGAHQKGALHLLNKLIPLVFTTEELASSCGQGLSSWAVLKLWAISTSNCS